MVYLSILLDRKLVRALIMHQSRPSSPRHSKREWLYRYIHYIGKSLAPKHPLSQGPENWVGLVQVLVEIARAKVGVSLHVVGGEVSSVVLDCR